MISRRCAPTSSRTIRRPRDAWYFASSRMLKHYFPITPRWVDPAAFPGTRELVIPRTPFIVPYRQVGNTLQMLRIYHGARRWPNAF